MRALIASPLGALVGFALGAVGGGGSVLAVPLLVFGGGLDARAATTGSLVVVGVTALGGAIAHARAGRVHLRAGLTLAAAAAVWSVAGSWLNHWVAPDVILFGFALLTVPVARAMWRRGRQERTRGDSGGGHAPDPRSGTEPAVARATPAGAAGTATVSATRAGIPTVLAAGIAVGLLTGFFGVGGGFVVIPALVLALHLSMPEAVGTSLVVIAINAAIALAARVTAGGIPWLAVLAFSAAGVGGASAGSRVAGVARPGSLEHAFGALLVVMGTLTAARALGWV